MTHYVLDTSALIALTMREKGFEVVSRYFENSIISSVNYAEFFTFISQRDFTDEQIKYLSDPNLVRVIDFDREQSVIAGQLVRITKSKGLSLGDRACLALAVKSQRGALTSDKAWATLKLAVEVKLFR